MGAECEMWSIRKIPLNGRRDTADKVQSTCTKIPFILSPSQPAGHGGQVLEMEMQENPLYRTGTAEKVLCSASQVPFIIDQSGQTRNLAVLGHGR